MTWCDKFSLSCRNESKIEYLQANKTISTDRPRLWMCDRGHIQTVLPWLHTQHEDGVRVTQANAFLSPVPLNGGPSVELRGLDSPLGAVPLHCCSASFPKTDVLFEELYREGNISKCDSKPIVVVVDNQPTKPMRNGVDSFDTAFTEIPCGNSACGTQMFVHAASVSPPANVMPTSECPRIDLQLLGTHESRNCLRGSSVKNGEPIQTLD